MDILARVAKFTMEKPFAALGIAAGAGIAIGVAGRHYAPKVRDAAKEYAAKRAAAKLAEAAKA